MARYCIVEVEINLIGRRFLAPHPPPMMAWPYRFMDPSVIGLLLLFSFCLPFMDQPHLCCVCPTQQTRTRQKTPKARRLLIGWWTWQGDPPSSLPVVPPSLRLTPTITSPITGTITVASTTLNHHHCHAYYTPSPWHHVWWCLVGYGGVRDCTGGSREGRGGRTEKNGTEQN